MEARRQWRDIFKKEFHNDKKVKSLQELMILKVSVPKHQPSKYVIHKWTRIEKIQTSTVIVVVLSGLLWQQNTEIKFSKAILLNKTINKHDLIDICRTLCPTTEDYISYASKIYHKLFSQISKH